MPAVCRANALVNEYHSFFSVVYVRPSHVLLAEVLRRSLESTLTAAVAMMNQALRPGSRPQRLFQCVQNQIRTQRIGNAPTDDATSKDIDDERDIDKARPGCDKGDVGHPQLVRPGGSKLPIHQVGRSIGGVIAYGGSA